MMPESRVVQLFPLVFPPSFSVATFSLLFDLFFVFFFFNDTATTEIYTLSYTTLFRSPLLLWNRLPEACLLEVPVCLAPRSEEHTSELQSLRHLVCRLLLEKKKKKDG